MESAYLNLDRIDIRILDILQKDGKISNIKLAEKVNYRLQLRLLEYRN